MSKQVLNIVSFTTSKGNALCSYPLWKASYRKRSKMFTSRRAARTWIRQQRQNDRRVREAKAAL
jgi:hypothetical protein